MTNIRNKQRPFRMLKYLYENTDENHPVSTPELVKIFQAEDAHASRKTIKDDIDVLIGEGFDIVTVRSTQNSFFLANRKFEIPEIKLLIDAVSSSRFINPEKSAVLIEKLTGMVSKAQAEKIRRHLYTADRVKADNRQIYYIVDAVTDAITTVRSTILWTRLPMLSMMGRRSAFNILNMMETRRSSCAATGSDIT